MNNTSLGQVISPEWHPVFVTISLACYSLIISISLLGNSLVCLAIFLNKSLRSSPTMSFIFSLACCDLLTASFAMPFDAENLLLHGVWRHGEVLCIVWTTSYLFSVPTSILTLLILTVDRYKTLSDPLRRFRKSKFFSVKSSRVVVVALWCYSLLFSLLPVLGWKHYPSSVIGSYCYFNITPVYSALSSVLHFILPLLVIGGIYFKINRIAQNVKNCQQFCDAANSSPGHIVRHPTPRDQGNFKRNVKATKTIAFIICVLFICWFPYSVASMVLSLCKPCFFSAPQELLASLLMLGYLNSALNPFIYSLSNRKFKETYCAVFLSIRQIGRNVLRRSKLWSQSSDSSISSRRHVSVMGQTGSIQLTAYTVSLRLHWNELHFFLLEFRVIIDIMISWIFSIGLEMSTFNGFLATSRKLWKRILIAKIYCYAIYCIKDNTHWQVKWWFFFISIPSLLYYLWIFLGEIRCIGMYRVNWHAANNKQQNLYLSVWGNLALLLILDTTWKIYKIWK